MKTIVLNLFGGMIIMFCTISCSTDDAIPDQMIGSADIAEIKSALMTGDWAITYYFDTDTEETNDYLDYVFTFNSDGVIAVTNGNTSVSGAWSITETDNSNDDSISSDIDFNILFSSPAIFEELSDDWDIKKYTNTKIELIDVQWMTM